MPDYQSGANCSTYCCTRRVCWWATDEERVQVIFNFGLSAEKFLPLIHRFKSPFTLDGNFKAALFCVMDLNVNKIKWFHPGTGDHRKVDGS